MDNINDEKIEKWIENCPEHDTEIMHTDEDGIVLLLDLIIKKKINRKRKYD